MRGTVGARSALAGLLLAWIATPSPAQQLPDPTPPVTGLPTREEIDRPELRPTPERAPRLTVDDQVERAPCPLAAPAYQNVRFTLREVAFNNLTAVPAEALRDSYAEFVGRDVPIATVCEIRDRAATILRGQGYLAAVQVPPQEITDGVVRLDVLMARITAVQVRGSAGGSERLITGFLDRLTAMPVFNQFEAERALLLLRDLPGYDIRLTLRPAGTGPGEVIGEVAVIHTPIEADLAIQNFGSREVGRFGGLLRFQFNGLTGLGDRTSIGVYSSADFDEQLVLQASHDFAIGNDGLRLGGRIAHAWAEPGGASSVLDIKSRTLIAGFDLTYPFIRSQVANLYGAAGFDFVDQEIDFFGQTFNRDKLRVAYLRLDADTTDGGFGRGWALGRQRVRAGLSLELRKGLDILDASEPCGTPATCVGQSRVPGTSRGFVLRGTGAIDYRPTPLLSLWVSPRAQYSDDPLLAFEEFSGGNYTAGRGYDPGAIIGDSGVGLQAELRYGSPSPTSRTTFAFQPYAFVDAARSWNNRDGSSASDHLVSAGAGIRAAYGDRARIDVSLAVPLKRLRFADERPDPRLLISLTTRLLPWIR